MAFTGFSSDEEGSIVFDGEQFIINNPENVPVDFNPHGRPVIGLPVTHPNHPQNQQPVSSSDPVTGLAPFDTGPSVFHTHEYTQYVQPPSSKEEAERREQRKKKHGSVSKTQRSERPMRHLSRLLTRRLTSLTSDLSTPSLCPRRWRPIGPAAPRSARVEACTSITY